MQREFDVELAYTSELLRLRQLLLLGRHLRSQAVEVLHATCLGRRGDLR